MGQGISLNALCPPFAPRAATGRTRHGRLSTVIVLFSSDGPGRPNAAPRPDGPGTGATGGSHTCERKNNFRQVLPVACGVETFSVSNRGGRLVAESLPGSDKTAQPSGNWGRNATRLQRVVHGCVDQAWGATRPFPCVNWGCPTADLPNPSPCSRPRPRPPPRLPPRPHTLPL